MDYLVYAYLQSGRQADAAQVVQQLDEMPNLDLQNFKIGYAATAMRARYAVEQSRWSDAANIADPVGAPPHVVAIALWARGLGLARQGQIQRAQMEIDRLRAN